MQTAAGSDLGGCCARASLYASDGTAAGSAVLTRAADDPDYIPLLLPDLYLFANFGGNEVLFSNHATGLWVSDGTAKGTRQLFAATQSQVPGRFTPVAALGAKLIFAGHRIGGPSCDPGEIEPWVTDGVRAHTRELKDLNPYFYDGGGSQCEGLPLSSYPGPGVALGAEALFAADDLVHGRELFASDGTAAGTRLVADINPAKIPNTITDPPGVPANAGVGSDPTDLVVLGSHVLFVADDGTTGRQLWITNATGRGTYQVTNWTAAEDGSSPHDLGTWRLADIAPGAASSNPGPFAVAGNQVLFGADDGEHGRELWALPVSAVTAGTAP